MNTAYEDLWPSWPPLEILMKHSAFAFLLHTAISTPQPGFSLQYSQAATAKKKMAQRLSPQPPNPHFQVGNVLLKANQQEILIR